MVTPLNAQNRYLFVNEVNMNTPFSKTEKSDEEDKDLNTFKVKGYNLNLRLNSDPISLNKKGYNFNLKKV